MCISGRLGAQLDTLPHDDATTALFSESTGRVLVSVPRDEDVRFLGLCAGRDVPVLRIGVTDADSVLEVQDRFTVSVQELRETSRRTLQAAFGN